MLTLTAEQVARIKELQDYIVNKLEDAIGAHDSKTPGILSNELAPCLIGQCIEEAIEILHIINTAEKNV